MQPTSHHHRSVAALDIGRLALLAGSLLVCGCGYSNESLHPQTIRTVYVEMFQSREFRRGIEFELTEALRKEINVSTPYTNAPPEKADTILSGEVLEWRESSLGWDPIAIRPRETAATLIVRYRWKDVRTGKLLRDRPRFVTTVTYVRPAGETAAEGRLDAVSKLARNIVGDMENSW
ncbi:MAG TPA: LPS assembly lipoprotein LptE [Phycisphaerae bacterium]|nr:LPS assembly lipoprotein LptE [Phycisphaerae bacterium]HRR86005.1 LPS assembly lipoprotein LptE [Phycisphaerae bacterium]